MTLIPDDPLRQHLDLHFTTVADVEGRFAFNSVPARHFKVFAWEQIPAGAHQSAEFMRPFEGRGIAVSIEDGRTIDVRVPRIAF